MPILFSIFLAVHDVICFKIPLRFLVSPNELWVSCFVIAKFVIFLHNDVHRFLVKVMLPKCDHNLGNLV